MIYFLLITSARTFGSILIKIKINIIYIWQRLPPKRPAACKRDLITEHTQIFDLGWCAQFISTSRRPWPPKIITIKQREITRELVRGCSRQQPTMQRICHDSKPMSCWFACPPEFTAVTNLIVAQKIIIAAQRLYSHIVVFLSPLLGGKVAAGGHVRPIAITATEYTAPEQFRQRPNTDRPPAKPVLVLRRTKPHTLQHNTHSIKAQLCVIFAYCQGMASSWSGSSTSSLTVVITCDRQDDQFRLAQDTLHRPFLDTQPYITQYYIRSKLQRPEHLRFCRRQILAHSLSQPPPRSVEEDFHVHSTLAEIRQEHFQLARIGSSNTTQL